MILPLQLDSSSMYPETLAGDNCAGVERHAEGI